jgi:tetratricopeptide (TPR) repeat protein
MSVIRRSEWAVHPSDAGDFSATRSDRKRPARPILSSLGIRPVALPLVLLALACLPLLASCGTRVKRVQVPLEDVRRANELVREGDISFARRDFYPALIKYTEAAKLNPNSEVIANKVGISYSAMGYYGEAEAALRRALGLNYKFYFAHNNLGTVYFAQGDHARAQKQFRKAIQMEPRIASFHINLGQSLMESGQYEKALAEIRKGLALDPNVMDKEQNVVLTSQQHLKPNPMKSYNLARVYASLKDVKACMKYLREALENGFTHLDWVDSEMDFDAIRSDTDFALFLSEARMKYRQTAQPTPPPPQPD